MNGCRYRQRTVAGLFAIAVLSLVLLQGVPVYANDKMEADQLVEKANLALQSFMCDEKMGAFRDLVRNAKGVMIVPSLLEGAFMVGASGGNGVFLSRDKLKDAWSGPAFYTLGGASFGLQIGGQSSEVILLAMTDRGVTSFLGNSFKLGGDVGVALGPVGMGASAATANLSADILSFSRSKGLYGGISLDGAVVAVRDGFNKAYFKGDPSPTDILIRHRFRNPHSAMLAKSVEKASSGKMTMSECASIASASRKGSLARRY
jgi:lipid-binding SYLF domain-containing protein